MSQAQKRAPIYTREELEEKLKRLNEKVKKLHVLWSEASRLLDEVKRIIRGEVCWTITDKLYSAVDDLEAIVKSAIEDMAFHEILFDDVEGPYDLEFYQKPLGVVMLKENDVKPVVIWTDYEIVWYSEGERDE
jgi:predicted nuclease with TOPRIM domain